MEKNLLIKDLISRPDVVRVPEFDDYFVSRTGTIYSNRRNKIIILKPAKDRSGYLVVRLTNNENCIMKKVHRVVAASFFGHSDLPVNHKDFNKENNSVENLEYVTISENNKWNAIHGKYLTGEQNPKSKLDWAKVLTIHSIKSKLSYAEIGRHYSITDVAARLVCVGINWKQMFNLITKEEE
jgi:hypothetical protein